MAQPLSANGDDAAERRGLGSLLARTTFTPGAKAQICLQVPAARLKSCPFTTRFSRTAVSQLVLKDCPFKRCSQARALSKLGLQHVPFQNPLLSTGLP